jgi:UDP-N-acetyl-2-amino-2-deoxyglucuronate dehydrogenase
MTAQRLRVGFLGAGLIATYHSKMVASSGVEVDRAGVFDPDRDRASAFAERSGHRVLPTAEAVIDASDAVYVCTWTSEHLRLVAAAAAAGKHVFVEKPLATTLADAEALCAVLDAADVTNQVGLVLRHSPAYRAARELIEAPEAGRVMGVVFRDDQFIPIQGHYGSTWRGDVDLAGAGTFIEHSIHDVDMLQYLCGPVTHVAAMESFFHELPGIEDVMAATVRFAHGGTGTLMSIWHDILDRPSQRSVEVFCERRMVTIGGNDWWGPVGWQDSDGSGGTLGADQLRARPEQHPDRDFLTAAIDGRPSSPDVLVALDAHRVTDAVYRSAKADGQVMPVVRPAP